MITIYCFVLCSICDHVDAIDEEFKVKQVSDMWGFNLPLKYYHFFKDTKRHNYFVKILMGKKSNECYRIMALYYFPILHNT